jgi:hypothetical protein
MKILAKIKNIHIDVKIFTHNISENDFESNKDLDLPEHLRNMGLDIMRKINNK